jgi:cytosine/adenosine deaminase-related metal-dependent hydrolase
VDLHGMDGVTGLSLATLGGARVLGIEGETGTIDVGKRADLALVEISPGEEDPGRDVLEAAAGGGVILTVVGGDVIYNRLGV